MLFTVFTAYNYKSSDDVETLIDKIHVNVY